MFTVDMTTILSNVNEINLTYSYLCATFAMLVKLKFKDIIASNYAQSMDC